MMIDRKKVHELFLKIVEITPEKRPQVLTEACGQDDELRRRVEALLRAHDGPDSFLEKPSAQLPVTNDSAPVLDATLDSKPDPGGIPDVEQDPDRTQDSDRGGSTVETGEFQLDVQSGVAINDRYILQNKIGEGGMGEVWVAQQTSPVKRSVALKLIKKGMDSRAVISRFEQERQALAMMDHPNISRVLDGGVTSSGQPFFVMELVNGLPLTRFADEAELTTDKRLELFVQICHAIQHAHQKGIVHRDLKPANILVTMIDGRPVPKVIDFGVAKATGGGLTDDLVETQFGAVIGTLEYMAPEQAGFSGDDIDTRADIYSLGVVLYELLTGLRPIDRSRLAKVGLAEMIRVIKEDEPSKPSTRLSTDESLSSLAAVRGIEPRKLTALLKGELDWVVMKCLEKSRDRRYETANGLARDIQRFLAHEAVEARPASTSYRLQKFVQRNRGQVVAASLLMLALLAGFAGTMYGLVQARTATQNETLAKNDALDKQKIAEQERARADEQRTRAEQREQQAIEAVKQFGDSVGKNPELKNNAELESLRKTLLQGPFDFFKTLRDSLQSDADTRPESLALLATVAFDLGELTDEIGDKQDALRAMKESLEIRKRLVRENPNTVEFVSDLVFSHNNVGLLLRDTGSLTDAMAEYEQGRRILADLAIEHPDDAKIQSELAATYNNIGVLSIRIGKLPEALGILKQANKIFERLAEQDPDTIVYRRDLAGSHVNIGSLYGSTGRPTEALAAYEKAAVIFKQLATEVPGVEPENQIARTYINIGNLYSETGEPAKAREAYEQSQKIWRQLASENPTVTAYQRDLAGCANNLGSLLSQSGKTDEALAAYHEAREIRENLVSKNPSVTPFQRDLGVSQNCIASTLLNAGRSGEALVAFKQARIIRERLARENPTDTDFKSQLADTLNSIGHVLNSSGKTEEAWDVIRQSHAIQEKLAIENPEDIEIQSALAESHNTIGFMLLESGISDEAMPAFERSLAIREQLALENPTITLFQAGLGGALNNIALHDLELEHFAEARDRLLKAVKHQKLALAGFPGHPTYRRYLRSHYTNLLTAAAGLEDEQLAEEARRGLKEVVANDPRAKQLDQRMKLVLDGEPSKGAAELLAFADRAYDLEQFALAARWFHDALEIEKGSAYNGACSAALAGSGQGDNDPPIVDAERTRLRGQALAWLQSDLDIWSDRLTTSSPDQRKRIIQTLEHWQSDSDLSGIRDATELEKLSDQEKGECESLWKEVAETIARATAKSGEGK